MTDSLRWPSARVELCPSAAKAATIWSPSESESGEESTDWPYLLFRYSQMRTAL